MTVEIRLKGEKEDKVKTFEIPFNSVVKNITHLGVISFIGKEVNRVRPPKRNIGFIFNWMTAVAVADAIMSLAFPKEKVDIIDVETEEVKPEEEVKDEE